MAAIGMKWKIILQLEETRVKKQISLKQKEGVLNWYYNCNIYYYRFS